MWTALVPGDVLFVRNRAKLEYSTLTLPANGVCRGIAARLLLPAVYLLNSLNNIFELRKLTPEYDRLVVGSTGETDQQVCLTAAGRASIEELIRERVVGQGLRTG